MLALVLAAQLLLGLQHPVSARVIRSAPGPQTRPAIATNGTHYFAAWEHRGDVIGTRIDANGVAVDVDLGISLQPTWVYDMRPTVVWNGETWVVAFFSGPQPWPYGAKVVEVTTGGEVVTERTLVTPRDMTSIDLAWNGSAYLLVWRENPGLLRAQFFDRAFLKIGDELALGDGGEEISVASRGTDLLVAWTFAAGTYARLVHADGTLGETARIAEAARDVDVAANGVSYAVIAGGHVVAIDGSGAITARRTLPPLDDVSIAASGAGWIAAGSAESRISVIELDAVLRTLRGPELLDSGDRASFPAVAAAGDRALLLFAATPSTPQFAFSDIRGTFLDEPATTRLVSSGLMEQNGADAAWSERALGVVWYEGELWGEGLRFGRLSAGGLLLDGEGMPLDDGADARIASNGRDFAVVSSRESGTRTEVDLLPDGRTVVAGDSRSTRPLIASDGDGYLVVWTAPDGRVVGRRIGSDGTAGPLRAFPSALAIATAREAHDIVWTGQHYVVLTYETLGTRIVSFAVTATNVSADGIPGTPVLLESGSNIFLHGYSGRLAWNGQDLLYARSTFTPLGLRARVGLDGADFVVRSEYAALQDVAWDRGEWLYLASETEWRVIRGEEVVTFESAAPPRLAAGTRTAVIVTDLIERIPNHRDQSVRRAYVRFLDAIARRRSGVRR